MKTFLPRILFTLSAALVTFGTQGNLRAVVVTYQSGDFTGLGVVHGGTSVNSAQYLGWVFTLPNAATITGFGASLYLNGGSGSLFGAITSVANLSSFPASPSTFVPLVSAVLSPPVGYTAGSLTSASVSVALPAGTYALIFGGGRFGAGATPTGGMANIGSVPYASNTMLYSTNATDSWTRWTNGNYYFVTADVGAPPGVPDGGSTLALMSLGLAGIVVGVSRRRSAQSD